MSDRYYDNLALIDTEFDGMAKSGNIVDLQGDQSVDLPVVYGLGSELAPFTYSGISTGDEVSVANGVTNGFHLEVTTIGTQFWRPQIQGNLTTVVPIETKVLFTFMATINSGTPKITQIRVGGSTSGNAYENIVDGYNEVELLTGSSVTQYVPIEFDGRELFDIDITEMSVKEITIPSTSYISYFDATTKQRVQLKVQDI